jgi:hypothetical protein
MTKRRRVTKERKMTNDKEDEMEDRRWWMTKD